MAVGMIITCDKCGESYDEGKTSHFICDGGKALREKEKALAAFNAMPVDKRLEFLFKSTERILEKLHDMRFDGPIG